MSWKAERAPIANAAERFAAEGYLLLPNEVPLDVCRVAARYALLKQKVAFSPESPKAQVPGTHFAYADTLMETVLDLMHSRIEELSGLDLFPTYSYYRVYGAGDTLSRHRDREACEISATICLGHHYVHDDPEYRWAFYVDGSKGADPAGTKLVMNPGDLTLYHGCDIEHWRDAFDAKPGSYLVQAFLHYVDQNGPYREHRYDRRQGLGFPLAAKDPQTERFRALIDRAFPELAAGVKPKP